MLDGALVREDRLPSRFAVEVLRREHFLQRLVAHAERARQRLVRVDVGGDGLDAGARTAANHADAGRRRDRELVAEALHDAALGGIGAGAALGGQPLGGRVGLAPQVAEHPQVRRPRERALERDAALLQIGMEAHGAEADGALAGCGVTRGSHAVGRALDEVFEHVVEHSQHVLDEALFAAPLVPALEIHRGEAADRRARLTQVVAARRQQDLAAEIRLPHGEARRTLMWREMPIRRIDEQQIGLAGLEPCLEQALPQEARGDFAQPLAGVWAAQRERLVVAHCVHELVGDADAVMQVQALAIEVARRFADLDELLDLGVVHVDVDGRRAAPQRALRDRERQRIHDTDERNDPGGVAAAADGLADRAHAAPIGADAAAVRRQPDVLGPGIDDAREVVLDGVQEARDRQAAIRAAVAQDRRGRQEPELRHVVVEPLGVRRVVGIRTRDACKEILWALTGQEIPIRERRAPERRQQGIARGVDFQTAGQ